MFDLKKASEELSKSNIHTIQVAAAYSWGSRACVAFQNFLKTKDVRWYHDALEYYHESLEHAALVENKKAGTLKEVQNKIQPLADEALLIIKKKSFV